MPMRYGSCSSAKRRAISCVFSVACRFKKTPYRAYIAPIAGGDMLICVLVYEEGRTKSRKLSTENVKTLSHRVLQRRLLFRFIGKFSLQGIGTFGHNVDCIIIM